MNIQEVKAKLREKAVDFADVLDEIVHDKYASPNARLKAIEMAFDRIGLIALKGTINQTLQAQVSPQDLLKAFQEVQEEHKRTEIEIRELKGILSAPQPIVTRDEDVVARDEKLKELPNAVENQEKGQ